MCRIPTRSKEIIGPKFHEFYFFNIIDISKFLDVFKMTGRIEKDIFNITNSDNNFKSAQKLRIRVLYKLKD